MLYIFDLGVIEVTDAASNVGNETWRTVHFGYFSDISGDILIQFIQDMQQRSRWCVPY